MLQFLLQNPRLLTIAQQALARIPEAARQILLRHPQAIKVGQGILKGARGTTNTDTGAVTLHELEASIPTAAEELMHATDFLTRRFPARNLDLRGGGPLARAIQRGYGLPTDQLSKTAQRALDAELYAQPGTRILESPLARALNPPAERLLTSRSFQSLRNPSFREALLSEYEQIHPLARALLEGGND